MVSGKIDLMTSEKIFQTFCYIWQNEGISFKDLKTKLKIDKQTLSNRLTVLANAELIIVERNQEPGHQKERFYKIEYKNMIKKFNLFSKIPRLDMETKKLITNSVIRGSNNPLFVEFGFNVSNFNCFKKFHEKSIDAYGPRG